MHCTVVYCTAVPNFIFWQHLSFFLGFVCLDDFSSSSPLLSSSQITMLEGNEDRDRYGQHISRLRAVELPALVNQVYLDSSAQPAVPRSILDAVHNRLINGEMISNPHSNSPSGSRTRQEIDEVRSLICSKIFNVTRQGGQVKEGSTESGWELVFTSGATASLQTVVRSFHFDREGRFAYLEQNHSSVLGLREVVQGGQGCDVLSEEEVVEWVTRQTTTTEGVSLLALPLQCNATGKRFNKLVASVLRARKEAESTTLKRNVYILLDVASYLSPSTNLPLLTEHCHQPDFLCFSFLKILGYPSGLGGLLILRDSASILLSGKQYYGGGTLEAITSRQHWKKPAREITEAMEDGTQNLFGIIAVKSALQTLRSDKLLKSWNEASDYVDYLTNRLCNDLGSLRHRNGSSLVQIYSGQAEVWSRKCEEDLQFHLPKQSQGPIILFNILRSRLKGESIKSCLVDPAEVDRLACVEDIHIRAGRMCNVGAITKALELDEKDIQVLWERGIGCGSVIPLDRGSNFDSAEEDRLHSLISSCLRISLSAWNTVDDLIRFVKFLSKYFLNQSDIEAMENEFDEGVNLNELSDLDSMSGDICERSSHTSSPATSESSYCLGTMENERKGDHYIKDLFLYPIKSCASQHLIDSWRLTSTGLEYDRQFCIVDMTSGKVLSQKQVPKMARIQPRIDLVSQSLQIALIDDVGKVGTTLSVPLAVSEEEISKTERGFDHCGKVLHPSLYLDDDNLCSTLSSFLDRNCTLARYPIQPFHNKQDRTPLLFSNESPFLLITSESVGQVCQWIKEEEESDDAPKDKVASAFRSNFIISSNHDMTPAFYENTAQRVKIGPHSFAVMGPCRRCQMIALDQTNGESAREILTVVARHCRCQEGKLKGRLVFGLHLMWLQEWNSSFTNNNTLIRAGMPVQIEY